MDQRQEWEESLSKFFISLKPYYNHSLSSVIVHKLFGDFTCLGKDKKWSQFKVLKIQLRISFEGIEIGRIRLQFCEDIYFYRKLKIEVGMEGPMDFRNEQSNPEL